MTGKSPVHVYNIAQRVSGLKLKPDRTGYLPWNDELPVHDGRLHRQPSIIPVSLVLPERLSTGRR